MMARNAQNTIEYAYDSAGRIVSESGDFSSDTYTYDEQARLASVTEESIPGPTTVLSYTYDGDNTKPSSEAATIDGTADYVNTYEYDSGGNLTEIIQTSQSGGNAVAEKEIDLTYNEDNQVASITRSLDSELVVTADYDYDACGRLVGLVYQQVRAGLKTAGVSGARWAMPLFFVSLLRERAYLVRFLPCLLAAAPCVG